MTKKILKEGSSGTRFEGVKISQEGTSGVSVPTFMTTCDVTVNFLELAIFSNFQDFINKIKILVAVSVAVKSTKYLLGRARTKSFHCRKTQEKIGKRNVNLANGDPI